MIAQKVRIPQKVLKYNYDSIEDILDIYIGEPEKALSDEIAPGVFCYYSRNTDELIGASIMYYSLRNVNDLNEILPFAISYNID